MFKTKVSSFVLWALLIMVLLLAILCPWIWGIAKTNGSKECDMEKGLIGKTNQGVKIEGSG